MVSPFASPTFPTQALTAYETAGASTGASRGTTLTASTVANNKGAYVQLIASTTRKSTWAVVVIAFPSVTPNHLIDIATGGAGSEVNQISNIYFRASQGATAVETMSYQFPITIAAGTRVAARVQSGAASGTVDAVIYLGGAPG